MCIDGKQDWLFHMSYPYMQFVSLDECLGKYAEAQQPNKFLYQGIVVSNGNVPTVEQRPL